MQLLLENQTANTTGTQTNINFIANNINLGKGAVIAFGTFDTCTVTLEFSPDEGDNWYTVGTDTTFTSEGWSNFEINGGCKLRGSVSSVGGSTDISLGIL
jgi:hypothetical protein